MKNLKIIITIVAISTVLIIWNFGRGNNAGDRQYIFEPQTNSEGAVSMTILPKNISDSGPWEFAILLDTHSVELNEDLISLSVLLDDNGKEYKPLRWEGDLPGGHHREGTLIFDTIKPTPKTLRLILRQIGGIAEREFLWTIRP